MSRTLLEKTDKMEKGFCDIFHHVALLEKTMTKWEKRFCDTFHHVGLPQIKVVFALI